MINVNLQPTVDDDEEEDDELGYSDTYAQYWPSKCEFIFK